MKALTPSIRILAVLALFITCAIAFIMKSPESFTQQKDECLIPVTDCNSPVYLGLKKPNCPCFACKKAKPTDPLRLVCTSDMTQAAALFLKEERADPLYAFTQQALTEEGSAERLKKTLEERGLDPHGYLFYTKQKWAADARMWGQFSQESPAWRYEPDESPNQMPRRDMNANTNAPGTAGPGHNMNANLNINKGVNTNTRGNMNMGADNR